MVKVGDIVVGLEAIKVQIVDTNRYLFKITCIYIPHPGGAASGGVDSGGDAPGNFTLLNFAIKFLAKVFSPMVSLSNLFFSVPRVIGVAPFPAIHSLTTLFMARIKEEL